MFDNLWKFNPDTFSWKEVKLKGNGLLSITRLCCCCIVGDCVIFGRDSSEDLELFFLDLRPSLKTLSKLVVIQHGLDRSELPHDIRWELAAMTTTKRDKTAESNSEPKKKINSLKWQTP